MAPRKYVHLLLILSEIIIIIVFVLIFVKLKTIDWKLIIWISSKILTVEKLTELEHCFVTLSKYNYNINSIRDLEDYPLILPVSHSFHRKKLNDLAFDCDTTFKNVVAIETSEMIRESIVQDLGIGYIIKDVVKREIDNGTMKVLKIEEELPKISLNLVYIDKYLTNIPKLFIDEYLK